MAQPITIPLLRDPAFMPGDFFEIEITPVATGVAAVLSDRVRVWGSTRESQGFGFGSPDLTLFGQLVLLPDATLFGAGGFGVGAGLLEHNTRQSFVAGDYSVRARARDAMLETGNVSAWSSPVTIEHRPTPPPPTNLRMVDSELHWDWSDP